MSLPRVSITGANQISETLTSGNCNFGPRLAGSMRTASISLLAFSMIGGSAHCQAVGTADEVSKGRHLATMLCTTCHVVAPDQPYAPTLNPPVPSFVSIAQRLRIDMASLRKFLTSTRQGL